MSDSATTLKGPLAVGLAKWLGTVGLVVFGGIKIFGPSNVIERTVLVNPSTGQSYTAVVATGAVIQLNGFTVRAFDTIGLTMTGGTVNYDIARICPSAYGISGSGLVLRAGIGMVRNPAAAKFTIAFTKAAKTASSSLVVNFNNISVGSGSSQMRGGSGAGVANTAYSRWNGSDCITVKSLTNLTAGGSGYLILEAMDDPSS